MPDSPDTEIKTDGQYVMPGSSHTKIGEDLVGATKEELERYGIESPDVQPVSQQVPEVHLDGEELTGFNPVEVVSKEAQAAVTGQTPSETVVRTTFSGELLELLRDRDRKRKQGSGGGNSVTAPEE